MKHIFRLLLLLCISTGAFAQSIVPLGAANNTVEVKGGLTADSALAVPWTSSFIGKGTDVNRRIESSRIDSLPTWMRRSARLKILTQWDSGTYYIPPSQKANPLGVATLDASGHVPPSQLPSIVYSGQVFVDANMAAMLAHVGATAGALSIRTDSSNEILVLLATPSSIRANWAFTTYTQAVLAFNLRTGAVFPRAGDYITDSVAEGVNNLYFTAARAQAQIWLDTSTRLATQYYVNTHSASNLQTLLIGGDSTTRNFVATYKLPNASLTGTGGWNAFIGIDPNNGYTGRMNLRDTMDLSGLYYNSINAITSAGKAELHIVSGASNLAIGHSPSVNLTANYTTNVAQMQVTGWSLGAFMKIDTAHFYMGDGTNTFTLSHATMTASRSDTLPNKSGTIALTSDVSAIGLNSVLTVNPNTNQAINIGKTVSGYPLYRNVYLGLGADSSGLISLLDTNGSATIVLSTSGGDPNVLVSASAGVAVLDATNGVYAQGFNHSIFLTQRSLNFFSTAVGKYTHANDSAYFSVAPIKIGKLTSTSRQFGSTYVGLSGGSDSSGRIVVQDTANATIITLSSASTSAILTCASTTNTSIVSSSTGLTSFHIIGNGSAPSIAAGSGAGTSPTISVTGTDLAGYITVTVGTSPGTGTLLGTITFATAYGSAPRCIVLAPANKESQNLSGLSMPYVSQSGILTTGFPISIQNALTATTTYQFYYQVIR